MKLFLLLVGIMCMGCAPQQLENPWTLKPGRQYIYSQKWNKEVKLNDTITIVDVKCGYVTYTRKDKVTYGMPRGRFMYCIMPIR